MIYLNVYRYTVKVENILCAWIIKHAALIRRVLEISKSWRQKTSHEIDRNSK